MLIIDFSTTVFTKILVLREGLTFGFNGNFGSPKKKFTINCNKSNKTFCLSLHYNVDNSYLLVNGK